MVDKEKKSKSLNFLKIFIFAILCVLLGVIFYLGLSKDPRELPSNLLEKKFPNFELANLLTADKVTNLDLPKQKLIINVFASWCYSCLQEHKFLFKLSKEKGFKLIGINYKDNLDNATAWLKQHGNPYDLVLFDAEGALSFDLGVYGVPETFIVDNQQIILGRISGALNTDKIESLLNKYA